MAMVSRSLRRYSGTASALALASGAMLSAGAPGCSDAANDSAGDAGLYEGGSGSASSDCTTCTTQECTGAWSVCLTDSRCVALRTCNNSFGESDGARAQCFCDTADASSPTADGGADPLAAYAAFAACTDARTCGKCASDCTSACTGGAPTKTTTTSSCGPAVDAGSADAETAVADAGDAGDAEADASDAGEAEAGPATAPIRASVDACTSCVAGQCGDAKKACALGTECSVFLACAYGCAGVACADACGSAHSTGKASAIELSSCTLTSCRSACGL